LVPGQHIGETEYERKLKSKAIVRWLHSFRFKHLRAIVADLAEEVGERPVRIVEVGCAHAALFELLNPCFSIDYTGIEVSEESVRVARQRHGVNPNFRVIHDAAQDVLRTLDRPDLIVALETLEHIPTRQTVRIIEAVADLAPRLFVCSVPVEIGPIIWIKNVGSALIRYDRRGRFHWRAFRQTFWAGAHQLDRVPTHTNGHMGFDWRWVGQTIRQEMKIRETRTLPFGFLPAGFATNVVFLAEPWTEEELQEMRRRSSGWEPPARRGAARGG
jgi:hypothetical protein